ncbi:MAG: nuclear transport factor 2 family protein [Pseudomonadota bacterium]
MANSSPDLAANEALIRSYFAGFSSGDPIIVSAHVSDDFVNQHLGILGGGCEGKSVYEERLAKFLTSFAQLRYDVEAVCVDAARGSARYKMHFQQDGRAFEVPGIMWFELANGLIQKRIDCWDGLTYLRQAKADAAAIAGLL